MPPILTAEVYTDGSCHTQLCIGAWAAIILIGDDTITLSGKTLDTTHNRMEVLAVVEALQYLQVNYKTVVEIKIISDSQYVIGLITRQPKFMAQNFLTKAGIPIRNVDLVKQLLDLNKQMILQFIKIKAHQKPSNTTHFNIEVDKLCRNIVRQAVSEVKVGES
jgi:ribonuclease HI